MNKSEYIPYMSGVVCFSILLSVAGCSSNQQDANDPAGVRSHQPLSQNASVQPVQQPVPPDKQQVIEKDKGRSHEQRRQQKLTEAKEMAATSLAGQAAQLQKRHTERKQQVGKPWPSVTPIQPMFNHVAPLPVEDRENYAHFSDNPVKRVSEHPVSTFSIDVDTGAYSNVRRMISSGRLPRKDAVRVEEMINYFDYQYSAPVNKSKPFSITTEMAPSPWNSRRHLLQVGIKGYDVDRSNLPASNLVFLVDVSGSMGAANKLPLLKSSLKLLAKQLRARDKISIVVYAGASGVVLNPVAGDQKAAILSSLDRLGAGGSTNGAAGIQLAYSLAEQAFINEGINRVILATDGDFNVGTVNFNALMELIEKKRQSGISLTTLGFGSGNYNDHLMEQLADKGNGNYAYIDTLNEAQKVLVNEMSSTLQTIARDVKIQVEFNPRQVAEYRLIGYENRALRREDFNNDKIDAGDIGAGHTVTALYEITLAGSEATHIDSLRYANNSTDFESHHESEVALLRLRYKQPTGGNSKLIESPLYKRHVKASFKQASNQFRFASSVAAFGQLLRGGQYLQNFGYQDVMKIAQGARGKDPFGYRGEYIRLVNLANSLQQPVYSRSH